MVAVQAELDSETHDKRDREQIWMPRARPRSALVRARRAGKLGLDHSAKDPLCRRSLDEGRRSLLIDVVHEREVCVDLLLRLLHL